MLDLRKLFGDDGLSDETEVPSTEKPLPLPDGEYRVRISAAKDKKTQKGGDMIVITFVVEDEDYPEYFGRYIWKNINIVNENETAQRIGRAELNQLRQAVGIESLTDLDQLLGEYCCGRVKIRTSTDPRYPDPQNEISNFRAE